jgi:hypothetical protein
LRTRTDCWKYRTQMTVLVQDEVGLVLAEAALAERLEHAIT